MRAQQTPCSRPSCCADLHCAVPCRPAQVSSGVEKGNLRELALARMGHLGLKCRDVRTRECGIQDIHNKVRGGAGWGAPWGRGLG